MRLLLSSCVLLCLAGCVDQTDKYASSEPADRPARVPEGSCVASDGMTLYATARSYLVHLYTASGAACAFP